MNKPLLIFPIADPHTGSIYGLHPYYVKRDNEWITLDEAGGYYYSNNPHYYLNSKQVRIWKHFERGVREAARLRAAKDCDLLIVVMGDANDGDHHGTHQLTTKSTPEQILAHVQIMLWVKEQFQFQGGRDKLIYIEGTEVHTQNDEEVIAQFLAAEKFPGGSSCIPFLELDVQDNLLWLYHHGKPAGFSYTRGNGLYAYVKKIYIHRRMNQLRPPNLVMTAHTHDHEHQVYIHNRHEIHGIICPPFQEKTRFTNRLPEIMPSPTRIGFSPVVIEDGKINVLPAYLAEMPLNEVLKW